MRMRFLWFALSLATVLTLILVACGGGTTTSQPTPTTAATATSQPSPTTATTATPIAVVKVQIVEKSNNVYAFDPAILTIKKGTEVIWTNTSDASHTVTSDTGAFNTPSLLMKTQTFKMTFATAGTFAYHCTVHPYMKATIIVTS